MKNQSGAIQTNLELYRVVMGGSGGYRRLPGGSDDISWQTLHHNIYITITNLEKVPLELDVLDEIGDVPHMPRLVQLHHRHVQGPHLRNFIYYVKVLKYWNIHQPSNISGVNNPKGKKISKQTDAWQQGNTIPHSLSQSFAYNQRYPNLLCVNAEKYIVLSCIVFLLVFLQ